MVLIYENACKINLDRILKAQKWAIRLITNSHYRRHTEPLFLKCNVLNVHDIFKLNLGTLNITLISFHQFFDVFTKHVKTHHYQTRND